MSKNNRKKKSKGKKKRGWTREVSELACRVFVKYGLNTGLGVKSKSLRWDRAAEKIGVSGGKFRDHMQFLFTCRLKINKMRGKNLKFKGHHNRILKEGLGNAEYCRMCNYFQIQKTFQKSNEVPECDVKFDSTTNDSRINELIKKLGLEEIRENDYHPFAPDTPNSTPSSPLSQKTIIEEEEEEEDGDLRMSKSPDPIATTPTGGTIVPKPDIFATSPSQTPEKQKVKTPENVFVRNNFGLKLAMMKPFFGNANPRFNPYTRVFPIVLNERYYYKLYLEGLQDLPKFELCSSNDKIRISIIETKDAEISKEKDSVSQRARWIEYTFRVIDDYYYGRSEFKFVLKYGSCSINLSDWKGHSGFRVSEKPKTEEKGFWKKLYGEDVPEVEENEDCVGNKRKGYDGRDDKDGDRPNKKRKL